MADIGIIHTNIHVLWVSTGCVIFRYDGRDLKVLLIEWGIEPFKGRWAFPGGFLNMDEDAIKGAKRELMEETGLEDAFIENRIVLIENWAGFLSAESASIHHGNIRIV